VAKIATTITSLSHTNNTCRLGNPRVGGRANVRRNHIGGSSDVGLLSNVLSGELAIAFKLVFGLVGFLCAHGGVKRLRHSSLLKKNATENLDNGEMSSNESNEDALQQEKASTPEISWRRASQTPTQQHTSIRESVVAKQSMMRHNRQVLLLIAAICFRKLHAIIVMAW